MKQLFLKYREIIAYLFFGGCTTLVNIAVYFLGTRLLHMGTAPATALAWLLSVLFAYVTNRRWVFDSKASGRSAVLAEMAKFFGGRVATGLMDIAIMYVFVDVLGFSDVVMKVLSNILVIVLNYIISKLMVFRNRS